MAVDYESLTPPERDTFVRNMLSEKEISAAIALATRRGQAKKTPEELLDFCFRIAVGKVKKRIEK